MTNKELKEIKIGYTSDQEDTFTYKKSVVERDINKLLNEVEGLQEENEKLRKSNQRMWDAILRIANVNEESYEEYAVVMQRIAEDVLEDFREDYED